MHMGHVEALSSPSWTSLYVYERIRERADIPPHLRPSPAAGAAPAADVLVRGVIEKAGAGRNPVRAAASRARARPGSMSPRNARGCLTESRTAGWTEGGKSHEAAASAGAAKTEGWPGSAGAARWRRRRLLLRWRPPVAWSGPPLPRSGQPRRGRLASDTWPPARASPSRWS